MKKKLNRVLKLSKETLRTLNEPILGDAQGGIRTTACPSGTVCSCPETVLTCESCIRCTTNC